MSTGTSTAASNIPLLSTAGLSKTYAGGVRAVQDVDLSVSRGQTLGIVGESGCGKSTTAKMMLRLIDADAGTVTFDGLDISTMRGRALRRLRPRIQIVPQHPRTSLNPRLTIRESIEFNLRVLGVPRPTRQRRVDDLLERVGINSSYARAHPHQLSGGQLQRVAIARALATEPDLVVCDEAVSALDKSVQAQVLNLLADLQRELGVAYVFISHDLAVVEHIADRVAVMYLGRVVEEGPTGEVWARPQHPYTQALLSSVPGRAGRRVVLRGDPPSPSAPPSGCGFRTRCSLASDLCAERRPELIEVGPTHRVACHEGRQP